MKEIYKSIKSNPLFEGINIYDYSALFNCLNAKTVKYKKNDVILLSGDPIKYIGLVVSGSVRINKEDWGGNQTILADLHPNELFGEVFACADIRISPVTVSACVNCEVLYFDFHNVTSPCSKSCSFHLSLIENMLKIIARKNLMLNQKIDILSKRTLREKLLCFFDYQRKGSSKFTISFNREELASFLCANRSVVSAELSRMQNDGLIAYTKNSFEIL